MDTGAGRTANADLATGIDHTMPGNVSAIRKTVQGVADLAGVSARTRERSDLAVGGHFSCRNAPDNLVDSVAHGIRHRTYILSYRTRSLSLVIRSRQSGPRAFSHNGPMPRDTSIMRSMSESGSWSVTPVGRSTPANSAIR